MSKAKKDTTGFLKIVVIGILLLLSIFFLIQLNNMHVCKNFSVLDSAKAATCTETGYTARKQCKTCGKIEESKLIEALGHDLIKVDAKDVTCLEDGYNTHKACSRKNCDYAEGKEVYSAVGAHTLQDVVAKAATCTDAGYTKHKKCVAEGCSYIEGYETTSAKGHSWEIVEEQATCLNSGIAGKACRSCEAEEVYETIPTWHYYDKNGVCSIAGCKETVFVPELKYISEAKLLSDEKGNPFFLFKGNFENINLDNNQKAGMIVINREFFEYDERNVSKYSDWIKFVKDKEGYSFLEAKGNEVRFNILYEDVLTKYVVLPCVETTITTGERKDVYYQYAVDCFENLHLDYSVSKTSMNMLQSATLNETVLADEEKGFFKKMLSWAVCKDMGEEKPSTAIRNINVGNVFKKYCVRMNEDALGSTFVQPTVNVSFVSDIPVNVVVENEDIVTIEYYPIVDSNSFIYHPSYRFNPISEGETTIKIIIAGEVIESTVMVKAY